MSALMAAIPYSLFTFGPFTLIPQFDLFGMALGPFQVHSFGLFVAIGLFISFTFGSRYAEKTMGVSGIEFQNFGITVVIIGWISAHVIDVLFYQPQEVLEDPLILFKVWGSISSYGGLFGGILGAFVWKWRNPDQDFVKFCDLGAMTLTFSWFFGRIGCASVHDHPGAVTDFFLGIEWPNGVVRYDLGFYEAIWWGVIVVCILILSRTPKPKGFYLAFVPLMYTPVRFGLDFLRVGPAEGGDIRYLGLTPAQYFSMIIFAIGLYFFFKIQNEPPEEWTQYVPQKRPENTDDEKYYKSKSKD